MVATNDTNASATLREMFKDRVAVIFACDKYEGCTHGGDKLEDLKYAVRDAELFRDTMEKCGVKVLAFKVNEECTNATMTSVLDDVETRFGEDQTLAQFIFYYAGHGIKDKNGRVGWPSMVTMKTMHPRALKC